MPLVTKTFSEIITFTRASSGTYFDATGTLQTATTDAARFDYDPSTLAARGFLVEEQRTNSIRNNTMQGAVAGAPGTSPTNWARSASPTSGISSEIIGTGTDAGITYIDIKFSGTASASFSFSVNTDTSSSAAATASQAWASSVYLKLTNGSLGNSTVQLVLNEYSSVPAFLRNTFSSTVTPTNAELRTQRTTQTVTTGASTAFVQQGLAVNFTNASVYDFTLRIGLPQLEQGAFATSVISTSSAAATRSADVASVNTLSPWYNASEGTLYAESTIVNSLPTNATAFCISGGTFNSFNDYAISVRHRGATESNARGVVQNVTSQADIVVSAATETRKYALGYKENDFAFTANGAAVTTDTSGTVPAGGNVNQALIGGASFTVAGHFCGYIRRITYYPRRLSNSELAGITA